MSARLRVRSGTEPHDRGGETSRPSHVYRAGIAPPSSNAELATSNDISAPLVSRAVEAGRGSPPHAHNTNATMRAGTRNQLLRVIRPASSAAQEVSFPP